MQPNLNYDDYELLIEALDALSSKQASDFLTMGS